MQINVTATTWKQSLFYESVTIAQRMICNRKTGLSVYKHIFSRFLLYLSALLTFEWLNVIVTLMALIYISRTLKTRLIGWPFDLRNSISDNVNFIGVLFQAKKDLFHWLHEVGVFQRPSLPLQREHRAAMHPFNNCSNS